MDWFNLSVVSLVGLAVGSFLNVCIDRLPAGLSLVSPPSHCSECQTTLKTLALV
ncbi:MAG: prepilin peptidase, partial [Chloroflexi bacterium]|nr:prepilin peptidase [Chloroflexota bacterium]